jgi:hypothetical protein
LLIAGCAKPERVPMTRGSISVTTGVHAPSTPSQVLGAVTATHGHGCGAFGSRGTYEGAYAVLRNRAAVLGADYVQILSIVEPHLIASNCFQNAFTIYGLAYRAENSTAVRLSVPAPLPPSPPSQPPASVQPSSLTGTYAGDITGNSRSGSFRVRVTVTMVQSGAQLVGTWTTSAGTTGAVSGAVSESGIRDWKIRQLEPCPGEFGGVAVLDPGRRLIAGSYLGDDCEGPLTATFAITRQGQ